jgi:hypothetical protein
MFLLGVSCGNPAARAAGLSSVSGQATRFRIWATQTLKELIVSMYLDCEGDFEPCCLLTTSARGRELAARPQGHGVKVI